MRWLSVRAEAGLGGDHAEDSKMGYPVVIRAVAPEPAHLRRYQVLGALMRLAR